jgi:hypothetical protein
MTPIMLQDTLVAELKTLFADFYLKNAKGKLSFLNIHPQYLPVKRESKDEEHFNYVVVVLDTAEDAGEVDPNKCNIFFSAGVHDDSPDRQGYRDIANIIDKIYEHLARERVFAGFEIQYPITRKYVLTGEGGEVKDTFPYYFGGVDTNWTVGKITAVDLDI